MRQKMIDGVLVTKPTREDVRGLKVGDLAPDCFGGMRAVTRIYAAGDDVKGKAYVCYYTEHGPTSQISGSLGEDEIVATVPLVSKFCRTDLVPW